MFSLFTSLINWLFRASVVKFVIFTAFALVLVPLFEIVMGFVDDIGLGDINGLLSSLPSGLIFYLSLFRLDVGLTLCVAAMLTKFFIRRLPIVG